jgi:hypothetical protein
VRTAAIPARCRAAGPLLRALLFACRDNADLEADPEPFFFSASNVARERFAEGRDRLRPLPLAKSCSACFRTCSELFPRFGGGNLTPARRAFDRPIAIACCTEAAPCFPSRTCSISSRTNSPACVDGDLPSSASFRARSTTCSSGIARILSRAVTPAFPPRTPAHFCCSAEPALRSARRDLADPAFRRSASVLSGAVAVIRPPHSRQSTLEFPHPTEEQIEALALTQFPYLEETEVSRAHCFPRFLPVTPPVG